MSQRTDLHDRFRTAPFLVADSATGKVELVRQAEAFARVERAGLFNSACIMNVGKALDSFATLVDDDDRSFTLKDIAAITSTPYSKANFWTDQSVIVPDVESAGKERRFSWKQAFIAGVCGSLRRQGVPLDTVRKVSTLLAKSDVIQSKNPKGASKV